MRIIFLIFGLLLIASGIYRWINQGIASAVLDIVLAGICLSRVIIKEGGRSWREKHSIKGAR